MFFALFLARFAIGMGPMLVSMGDLEKNMKEKNAFLSEAKLVDWAELKPELVQEQIEQGLAIAQEEIDEVCQVGARDATFENTFMALEEAGRSVNLAWGRVNHLTSVKDSPALREAYNLMLPKVSEFQSRIPLNEALWKALKSFAGKPEAKALSGIHKRLFDETIADFIQAGADLSVDKKKRLEEINKELAQKTQKFSENVLDATNAYELIIEDESKLAGLPSVAKEAARQSAREKDKGTDENPVWRFTLHAPSIVPALQYLDSEELRKELWAVASEVGRKPPFDNSDLISEVLKLRQEKAELLGKANFPDNVLQRRMAKTGETAIRFSEDLRERTEGAFYKEIEELEAFVAERTDEERRRLDPWSIAYWGEKLRRESYDFDEEELRPYFAIDQVLDGMFRIAERLFGLRIDKRSGSQAGWHEEVKLYDLMDASGELLGYFYADWHPREEKRGGAWMNYLDTGNPRANGDPDPHVGLICGNMTAPVGEKPALLTHREVETVFHEFGHLLHHLLGQVEVKSLNGVNVAWDFVELPSQIMENWCWNKESLDLFARHFESGERIPEALYSKMVAARNFQSAMAMMRQLSLGMMDLELHSKPQDFWDGDFEPLLRERIQVYLVPASIPSKLIVHRFTHLFSSPVGYASGYYSYKWAEVLDADAFTRFEREGIFNEATGRAFRECILSKGNSEAPMALFKRFMGREPNSDALLKRCGLE